MARIYKVHWIVLLLGLSLLGCSASAAGPAPTATVLLPATATAAPPTSTVCALPETPPPTQVSSVDVVTVLSADADLAAPTCMAGKADPLLTSSVSIPAHWSLDGTAAVGEYINRLKVAGVSFSWNTDDKYLYGAMSAETSGWVAVGFDPQNMMKGANYVFGYVQGGETHVQDMFGTKPFGSNPHPPDVELGGRDDIVAYSGREVDGVTTIEFQIPLDSGDAYDKVLEPGEHTLIVAFGQSDDFTSMHTSRGSGAFVISE